MQPEEVDPFGADFFSKKELEALKQQLAKGAVQSRSAQAAGAKAAAPPAAKPEPPKSAGAKGAVLTAAELCQHFALGDAAKQLLRDDLASRPFLDLLVAQQHNEDAVRLLAHLLPKREAVWWACLCAQQAHGPQPPPAVAAALQAAEKWVANPSEENRRAAQSAAEAADFGTPAGCAGLAAFWSGDSIAPAHVDAVPPPAFLAARAVTGAVLLAAVFTEPEKAPEKSARFLTQGIEVLNGSKRWP